MRMYRYKVFFTFLLKGKSDLRAYYKQLKHMILWHFLHYYWHLSLTFSVWNEFKCMRMYGFKVFFSFQLVREKSGKSRNTFKVKFWLFLCEMSLYVSVDIKNIYLSACARKSDLRVYHKLVETYDSLTLFTLWLAYKFDFFYVKWA